MSSAFRSVTITRLCEVLCIQRVGHTIALAAVVAFASACVADGSAASRDAAVDDVRRPSDGERRAAAWEVRTGDARLHDVHG